MPRSDQRRVVPPALLARARQLRRNQTPQETQLWQHLRSKRFHGLKFRRQHPFHRFVLDFYCHEQRLAIEIDGHGHAEPEQARYDQERTTWLEKKGLRVVRFTNQEIEKQLEGVLAEIARVCGIEH